MRFHILLTVFIQASRYCGYMKHVADKHFDIQWKLCWDWTWSLSDESKNTTGVVMIEEIINNCENLE